MGENKLTVDGTLTCQGPLVYWKTEDLANGITTTFQAGGMSILQITPTGGDMGSTDVIVKRGAVCPNDAFWSGCTDTPLSLKCYFDITPTTAKTATIRFCYLAGELNGQVHGPLLKPYRWNTSSGKWEPVGVYVSHGGSGTEQDPYYVEYSGISNYSPFVLGSQGDPSLPVTLSSFTAQVVDEKVELCWKTESEVNNLGFDVYRGTQETGPFVKLTSNLIPGAGNSSIGTDYQFTDDTVVAGQTYYYYIESVDFTGEREMSEKIKVGVLIEPLSLQQQIPLETRLFQNYPNPFNPDTWFPYQLHEDGELKFQIFDVTGRLVREFQLGSQKAGYYLDKSRAVHWDGRNNAGEAVASGLYFYRLKVGQRAFLKRLAVLK